MPKLAKKKFNPTVRNTPTFKKKWIKPGKKLRRENTTNTQFQAKKITLVEQISLKDDDDDEPQQQKTTATIGNDKNDGLLAQRNVKNLTELAPQLGHYNENLCRDAILGVRSHFFHSPEIVRKQLRLIIPGVGALLIRELKQTATRNQLKRLLEQLCELPTDLMQSHFQLLSQFVLTAISDLRPVVRTLGVDVLFMLLKKYPELCAKSEEIFNKYLQLFGQQRSTTQTADNKLKMLDSIHQFISAYRPSPKSTSLWQCQELDFNFSEQPSPSIQLFPTPNVFHFPIYNPDTASTLQSPMEKADGLMNCCQTLCSFLVATIREEELGMTKCKLNAVITRVFNAVSSLVDAVLTFLERGAENDDNKLNEQQIRANLAKAFAPLKKCPAIEGSKKLMEKLEMIGAAKK